MIRIDTIRIGVLYLYLEEYYADKAERYGTEDICRWMGI